MPKKACRYPNCDTPADLAGCSFFQFPKNPMRRKQWLNLMHLDENLDDKYMFICEKHIDPSFISHKSGRKSLLHKAVPDEYDPSSLIDAPEASNEEIIITNEGVSNIIQLAIQDLNLDIEYDKGLAGSPSKEPAEKKLKNDASNVTLIKIEPNTESSPTKRPQPRPRKSLVEKFDWLVPTEEEGILMCKFCQVLFKGTIFHVRLHEESSVHRNFIVNELEKPVQRQFKMKQNWNVDNDWLTVTKDGIKKCKVCKVIVGNWPTLIKRHKKSPKHRMNMYSKLKSKTPPATIDSNTSDVILGDVVFPKNDTLPEDANWLSVDSETRVKTCTICNKVIKGNTFHVRRHVETPKHQSAIADREKSANASRIIESGITDSKDFINNYQVLEAKRKRSGLSEDISWLIVEEDGTKKCSICKVYLRGNTFHIKRHVETPKHKKALIADESYNNYMPEYDSKQNPMVIVKPKRAKFNRTWAENFSWLTFNEDDGTKSCTICRAVLKGNSFHLKRHVDTPKHKKALRGELFKKVVGTKRDAMNWAEGLPWLSIDRLTGVKRCEICNKVIKGNPFHIKRHGNTPKHLNALNGIDARKKKAKALKQRPDNFKLFSWLMLDEETGIRKCKICNKFVTDNIACLKRHEEGPRHLRSIQKCKDAICLPVTNEGNSGLHDDFESDESDVDDLNPISNDVVETILQPFSITHNVPLSDLFQLYNQIKVKSEQLKEESAMEISTIEDCINKVAGPGITIEIQNYLNETKSYFSLGIGEISDDLGIRHMVFVMRFFYKGKIIDRFIGIQQIKDSSAIGIISTIEDHFVANNLDLHNLIGFVADDCDTMMGKEMEVATSLQNRYSQVYAVGCISHILNISVSNAWKVIPSGVYELLKTLNVHFTGVENIRDEFEELQKVFETPLDDVLKRHNSIWLYMEAVIDPVLEQWNSLQAYFNLPDVKLGGYEMTTLMKTYLTFLSFILQEINIVIGTFQCGDIKSHLIIPTLKELMLRIASFFIRKSYLSAVPIGEWQFEGAHISDIHNIFCGDRIHTLIVTLKKEERIEFKSNVLSFYSEFCNQLQNRIDFTDIVLNFMPNLEPHVVLSGEIQDVYPIIHLFPAEDITVLNEEWQLIAKVDELKQYAHYSVEKFWSFLSELKNPLDEYKFANISRVAMGILSIPHTKASVEKRIAEFNKQRLSQLDTAETNNMAYFEEYIQTEGMTQQWQPLVIEYLDIDDYK